MASHKQLIEKIDPTQHALDLERLANLAAAMHRAVPIDGVFEPTDRDWRGLRQIAGDVAELADRLSVAVNGG